MLRLLAAIIIGIIVDAILNSYTALNGFICLLGGIVAGVIAWYTLPLDRP